MKRLILLVVLLILATIAIPAWPGQPLPGVRASEEEGEEPGEEPTAPSTPVFTGVGASPDEALQDLYTQWTNYEVANNLRCVPADDTEAEGTSDDGTYYHRVQASCDLPQEEVDPGADEGSADFSSSISDRQEICVGAPVPYGWIIVDTIITATRCLPNWYLQVNVLVIERHLGKPIGATMTACQTFFIPEGWVVTATRATVQQCGPNWHLAPNVIDLRKIRGSTTAELAAQIRDNRYILPSGLTIFRAVGLATTHVSGRVDNANARQNILDTADGRAAARSCYGTAPCGTVALNFSMLRGMVVLAESYSYYVTEIAGGDHSTNSRHYVGVAIDVSQINGVGVSAAHPSQRAFRDSCRALGATEVLGPGDAGHAGHIHCAWPRP